MQIYDQNGKPMPGAVTFEYRGYQFSLSTIAQPNELLVFNSPTSRMVIGDDAFPADPYGIYQAMKMIDDIEDEGAE